MEDYLSKLEAQLEHWEIEIEKRIEDTIERHPEWMEKRSALELRIEEARRRRSEEWDILKAGVEVAWRDLKKTYEAIMAAQKTPPPPSPPA